MLGMFSAVSTGVTSLVLATSAVAPSPARAACAQTVLLRFAFCFLLAICNRSQTSFYLADKSTSLARLEFS